MASKAFTPSHMRDGPLVYSGRAVKRTKATPAEDSGNKNLAVAPPTEVTKHKGDLLIRDLCRRG